MTHKKLIIISGDFKYICNIHTNRPVSQTLFKKNISGIIKRKRFQTLSNYKIFILPTCCISVQNLTTIQKSKMFSEDLHYLIKYHLNTFQREHYMRINFSRFIHGPIVKEISTGITTCNENQLIQKFDINSAYISYYTQNVLLPTNRVVINYVGSDAQNIYESISSLNRNNSIFFWFKVILCKPESLTSVQKIYLGKIQTLENFKSIKYQPFIFLHL